MKNQIIVHSTEEQSRVALLENGELAQLFIESEENQRTVGNIYLARVHKVMSGIKACFIDMGTPKDAFLHFSDAGDHLEHYVRMLNGAKAVPKEAKNGNPENMTAQQKQNRVGKILRPGQKLLVQIVKEPIGGKGPRVSTDITLAGRYLVLIPMGNYVAVSRSINNSKERRRLKNIVSSMLPDGFGVIVRTVAAKKERSDIEEDMRDVLKKWERVLGRLEGAKPPALLYRDLDMTESLIRDLFAKHYDRILVDEEEKYNTIKSYVSRIAPQMLPSVEFYKGKEHIFDFMRIADDVDSIFRPRVRMPSGGYLIFEQTEAMYVVDVNSGPYAAKEKQEDNSLKTNLEAARGVAKQLRLRDIGGIIVVDFIDLKSDANRKKVYDELKKEFHKDPAKTNVLPMSDFGLVQITRQRIRPSVVNSVSKACPMCGGSGTVVSQDTIVTDLSMWLSKFRHSTDYRAVDIYINPYLKSYLEHGFFSIRIRWMIKYFMKINLEGDDSVSLNEFKATLPGSDIDISEAILKNESIDKLLSEHDQRDEFEEIKNATDEEVTSEVVSKMSSKASDKEGKDQKQKKHSKKSEHYLNPERSKYFKKDEEENEASEEKTEEEVTLAEEVEAPVIGQDLEKEEKNSDTANKVYKRREVVKSKYYRSKSNEE